MSESRFSDVSRRAFLRGSGIAGFVALVPGLAQAATKTTKKKTATTKKAAVANTTATTKAAKPAGAGATASGPAAIAVGQELVVNYTFAASGGRARNPYTVVWIENSNGELVQTVSLQFNPPKGFRWLGDLVRWSRVDQDRIAKGGADTAETISAATRTPGTYAVTWDGSTAAGGHATAGDYFVCIEAAREHGPYELIRDAITLNGTPTKKTLTPNGELVAASVEVRAKA